MLDITQHNEQCGDDTFIELPNNLFMCDICKVMIQEDYTIVTPVWDDVYLCPNCLLVVSRPHKCE